MTAKAPAPEEFRMSGAEFDKMMRGALSAPPPKAAPPKPRRAKKRKTTEVAAFAGSAGDANPSRVLSSA